MKVPIMHKVFIKVTQVHAYKMLSTMSGATSGNRSYYQHYTWICVSLNEKIKKRDISSIYLPSTERTGPVGEGSANILLCYQELDLPSLNKELHLR